MNATDFRLVVTDAADHGGTSGHLVIDVYDQTGRLARAEITAGQAIAAAADLLAIVQRAASTGR